MYTHHTIDVRQRRALYGNVTAVDTSKIFVVEVTVQTLGREGVTTLVSVIGAI